MKSDPKAAKKFCEHYRLVLISGRNTYAADYYVALKKGIRPPISEIARNIEWWIHFETHFDGVFESDAEEMAKNYVESFRKK